MLAPDIATLIIVSFLILFGLLLPILNRITPKFVSYRWSVVVVLLALLLGAVIDFDGLPDAARQAVIVGALVISGGYVFLRTVEKALANGWLRGVRLDVRKGDTSASIHTDGSEHGGKPASGDSDAM